MSNRNAQYIKRYWDKKNYTICGNREIMSNKNERTGRQNELKQNIKNKVSMKNIQTKVNQDENEYISINLRYKGVKKQRRKN